MIESSSKYFGLVVAYLLPGFIGLAGIVPLWPAIAQWFRPVSQGDLGIGPTTYAILAAITAGMIVSCFRWLLIDHLHHANGIRRPRWEDSRLGENLGAFNYLVEVHYRYYQFYSNCLVAIIFAYGVNRFLKASPLLGFGTDLGVAILCIVLFVGSRDALSNYYEGTNRLLNQVAKKDDKGDTMTNGRGHDHAGCATSPRTSHVSDKPETSNEKPAFPAGIPHTTSGPQPEAEVTAVAVEKKR